MFRRRRKDADARGAAAGPGSGRDRPGEASGSGDSGDAGRWPGEEPQDGGEYGDDQFADDDGGFDSDLADAEPGDTGFEEAGGWADGGADEAAVEYADGEYAGVDYAGDEDPNDEDPGGDDAGARGSGPRRAGPPAARPGRAGRRRGRHGRRPEDLGDPETWSRSQRGAPDAAPETGPALGPWDGAVSYPEGERLDFGCLQVPAREGFDIQINMAEEQGVWIAVVRGDSGLQLQAFAAPKTSGLWDEDRQEIAGEITASGGSATEAEGPFGAELHAMLAAEDTGPGSPGPAGPLQPVRFLGVDGPRWFLRGVLSGPAVLTPELAAPFEEIFGDIVVIRGDHPAPPRDLLEIQLPEQAREALEAQIAEQAEGAAEPGGPALSGPFSHLPNPFERGPEITETR